MSTPQPPPRQPWSPGGEPEVPHYLSSHGSLVGEPGERSGATVATLIVGWFSAAAGTIGALVAASTVPSAALWALPLTAVVGGLAVAGLIGLQMRRTWGWLILLVLAGLGALKNAIGLLGGRITLSTSLLLLVLLLLPGTRNDLD